MWEYTDKVKEYFFSPKNVGVLEEADGVGEVGSIACGDALKLMLKVEPGTEKILDAKFQTFGCGSAIASSSALTEMIIGKTVDEASKVTNQEIADYLGGLPQEKMHCSVMGREALDAAIANYRGIEIEHHEEEEGALICHCFGIHESLIEKTILSDNLKTVEEVTDYTKAGGGCGSCLSRIEEVLEKVLKTKGEEVAADKKPEPQKAVMTNLQKITLITSVIERDVRPALQRDGGDIDLIDVVGNEVIVTLKGQCSSCVSSQMTLRGVESTLQEKVLPNIIVTQAS